MFFVFCFIDYLSYRKSSSDSTCKFRSNEDDQNFYLDNNRFLYTYVISFQRTTSILIYCDEYMYDLNHIILKVTFLVIDRSEEEKEDQQFDHPLKELLKVESTDSVLQRLQNATIDAKTKSMIQVGICNYALHYKFRSYTTLYPCISLEMSIFT